MTMTMKKHHPPGYGELFKCLVCMEADKLVVVGDDGHALRCIRCGVYYPVEEIVNSTLNLGVLNDDMLSAAIGKLVLEPHKQPGFLERLLMELERRRTLEKSVLWEPANIDDDYD